MMLQSVALVAVVLGGAVALPFEARGGSFAIEYKQRRRDESLSPNDRLDAIIASHAHTRAKYGSAEASTLSKRAYGYTYLAGNQESYYASIRVGTPAHTYEVVLDTGSSDLVLAAKGATNLCGGQCVTDAPLYDPSSSSSAVNTNEPVELTYGTASASGIVVDDIVSFAGFSGRQAIASCNEVNNLTTSADQTGLLGLAWQPLAQTNSTPFVEALWKNGSLDQPLFAFGLAQTNPTDVPNPSSVVPGGILTVGQTNTTLYTGNINYVSLSDSGTYWDFPVSAVTVGGQSLGLSTEAAIADTGTNSLAVPQSVADAIYEAIPNSQEVPNSGGIYAYPCSSSVSLAFTMGGVSYSVPSKDFNTGIISRDGQYCAGAVTSLGSSSSSRDPSSELWILGTPLLQAFYTVYRFSPPAVGFAQLNDPNNVLEKGPIPNSNDSGNATFSSGGSNGSSSSGGSGGSTSSAAELKVKATGILSIATVILSAVLAL